MLIEPLGLGLFAPPEPGPKRRHTDAVIVAPSDELASAPTLAAPPSRRDRWVRIAVALVGLALGVVVWRLFR